MESNIRNYLPKKHRIGQRHVEKKVGGQSDPNDLGTDRQNAKTGAEELKNNCLRKIEMYVRR